MDAKMESKTQQNMVSCILKAPSFENCIKSSTHAAHLNRSDWYQIKVKKINPRVMDDKLVVDFRLGINPSFVTYIEKTEQKLIQKWKSFHPTERLFDIKLADASDGKNEIQYNQDDPELVDVVKLCWNRKQEIQLSIRFNCVSTQFDSIGNFMLDSILLLYADVSSQSTSKLIETVYCQVQIDWHGNVVDQTQILNFAKFESFDPDHLPEYYPEMSSESTFEIAEQSENDKKFNQKCLKHFLQDPITLFYDISNAKYVKTIFIQQNQGFTFKMISDFEYGELVVTKIILTLNGRPFNEDELYEWSQTAKFHAPMIEPNFESSKMSPEVQDIRVIKPCEIEIIWFALRETKETILSFKVNHILPDLNMPFLATIKSYFKNSNVKIGYAEIKIYSTKQNLLEEKQKDNFVKSILKQSEQLFQQIQILLKVVQTNFYKITDEFNFETKQMQNFMMDKNKEISDFSNLIKNVEAKMQQVKLVQSEMKIVENFIVKLTEFVVKFSQTNYDKIIEPNLELLAEFYAISKSLTSKQKLNKISELIKLKQTDEIALLNEIEQLFSQLIGSENCGEHLLNVLRIDRSKNVSSENSSEKETVLNKNCEPKLGNQSKHESIIQQKLGSTNDPNKFEQDNCRIRISKYTSLREQTFGISSDTTTDGFLENSSSIQNVPNNHKSLTLLKSNESLKGQFKIENALNYDYQYKLLARVGLAKNIEQMTISNHNEIKKNATTSYLELSKSQSIANYKANCQYLKSAIDLNQMVKKSEVSNSNLSKSINTQTASDKKSKKILKREKLRKQEKLRGLFAPL